MTLRLNSIILSIAFIALILGGCKKNDDPMADYPKTVTIKYEVTSTISSATADITVTNETGGDSELDEQSMPFTKTITKKVEFAEIVSLVASSYEASDLTLKIYVNNSMVENKKFESTSLNVGVLMHQFE